jgi:hypothetical protein
MWKVPFVPLEYNPRTTSGIWSVDPTKSEMSGIKATDICGWCESSTGEELRFSHESVFSSVVRKLNVGPSRAAGQVAYRSRAALSGWMCAWEGDPNPVLPCNVLPLNV